ncbi:MAG: hypothetical protein WC450_09905, partial [Candidatus Omnitrophota bacterium]
LRKQINAAFDPIIDKAHQAHKEAVNQKRRAEAPLAEAEGIIKPALAAWDTAQEAIRRQAEQEAQAAAMKAETDRKIAEAIALEAQGDKKAADQVMAEPVYVAPVIIPRSTPKVQGISFTERWTFRVINADLIPRQYLLAGLMDNHRVGRTDSRLTAIRKVVDALKGATNIPGIEAYAEKSVSGRG